MEMSMDKKIPPFFLGIEGFEAGHSAAESLTNSAQTARCILEGDRWKHEASGLCVSLLPSGERLVLKNEGKEERIIAHFSRRVSLKITPSSPRDTIIHYFTSCWQSEFQYHALTLEDAELFPASVHPIVKSFSMISKGSYTTCTYIPFVAIENKRSGKTLFLSLEPTANWKIEVGIQGDFAYISAGEIDGRHLDTVKILASGESYLSPRVLSGTIEGGLNEAIKILTIKKRGEKCGAAYPVVFNDYMNCLWAQPCSEKTYPLIEAAAEAGAEVFCIDEGWEYEKEENRTNRLGDWRYSKTLFGKDGFFKVIETIKFKGMIPGLWLEMEVAGENSEVYKKSDDWFLTRNGVRVGGGAWVFLDFRNPYVREYMLEKVRFYYNAGIRFIKNDYNDCIGNSGFDGVEYTRAVREFYTELRREFPDLMLENCASGGMRADYDMLRIFDIQSTSDQEIAANYPSIAQGALAHIPSEKAGMWAYPYPHLYDDFHRGKEFAPDQYDDESIVYTMLVGMSGVLYLSGRIDKGASSGKALIKEGVTVYKKIRKFTAEAYPSFPNGFVRIPEKQKAVVILFRKEKSDTGLLFVWRQEGNAEIIIPVAAKSAVLLYPKSAKERAICGSSIKLNFGRPYMGRLFEIDF